MGAIVSEYQSFWNGHTDEMRRIDWENNHVYNEEADLQDLLYLLLENITHQVIKVIWDKHIMTG